MKTVPTVMFVVIAVCRAAAAQETTDAARAYPTLPLVFEINEGQTDARVAFVARGRGAALFFAPTEIVAALQRNPTVDPAIVRVRPIGANPDVRIEGVDELRGRVNYLVGDDPTKWHRGVATYARVRYRDVYPGINLVYYGVDGQLEYDFVVAAGADPHAIRLAVEGATLLIDAAGDLVARLDAGEIRMRKPVLYQQAGGARVPVRGEWLLESGGQVRFRIGDYDAGRTLVIDPVLSYSTYLAASNDDTPARIAVDATGHVYVTGHTSSTNYPTTAGAFARTRRGSGDAFVTKLDPSGSSLVYSTYLGGSASDAAAGIAIDRLGNAYIAGGTQSADFPGTAGAARPYAGGSDAFVAKLDATGSLVLYGMFVGGSGDEGATSVAIDPEGSAYIVGATSSSDFPVSAGAIQPMLRGPFDVFVAKVDPSGMVLRYATYLGSSFFDHAGDIAVDAGGHAYVTGIAREGDFPTTPGAFQTTRVGISDDAFVSKLNPTGTALVYSTYLSGTANDYGFGIAVDALGSAYVTGGTQSADFPLTPGAFQTTVRGDDGYVTKLHPSGAAVQYSTLIGGSDQDWSAEIAVDARGNVYLTGSTRSTDFPTTPGTIQSTYGGQYDGFVARLTPTLSALVYSTYLGGSAIDGGVDIAADEAGAAYVGGYTASRNFPVTPGAFQTTARALREGFVTKITHVTPASTAAAKVTGGGTVGAGSARGTFSLSVQRRTDAGTIGGNLQYVNHATRARVKAVAFTTLSATSTEATIEGTCTINGAPCTFIVTVEDRGEPGRRDRFTISVSAAAPQGGILRGGNIRIHE